MDLEILLDRATIALSQQNRDRMVEVCKYLHIEDDEDETFADKKRRTLFKMAENKIDEILNADSDEDQVSEELRADVEKTDGETSQRLEEVSEVIKANLWSRHGERKVMFASGKLKRSMRRQKRHKLTYTWRGWAPATAKTDVEEIVRQLETRKNALKRQKEAEFNKAALARTAAEDERAQFALVQLRQDQAQRSKLAEAQIAAEEAREVQQSRLCGVVTWVRRAAEKWLTRRGRAVGQAKWEARVLDKRKGKPVPLRGTWLRGR
ncbi:hypothetical protein F7725_017131 [Dissostichus mawsoni]|uniref:Uncharacterized protein n=1 Tax=Dissostichus mawsoni TaxID=36200 RepID=A0A7J5Z7W4_DISMA|nr:hypothetical protein F7725_017131 [Dissostichus mawsoni]